MIKFKVGKSYKMNSLCDTDCVWSYTVVRRTAKTLWIKCEADQVTSNRISVYDNIERVYPLGKYSMCPVLTAEKEIKTNIPVALEPEN